MSTETIRFKNPTKHTLKLGAIGLPDVAPGGEIDVPLGICAPTIRDNGQRGASVIEKCAPQMVPVDPEDHEEWLKTPKPNPPKSLMVTTQGRPPGVPAGVAALQAAKAAKAAKAAAKTAKPTPTTQTEE